MTLMINVTALRIPNIRHTIRQSRPRPPTKSGSDERPLAEDSAQIHSRYCLLFEQRPRSVRRWGSVGPLAWTGYEGLRGGFDLITVVRLCEDVRPFGQNRDHLPARWALDGRYCEYL